MYARELAEMSHCTEVEVAQPASNVRSVRSSGMDIRKTELLYFLLRERAPP